MAGTEAHWRTYIAALVDLTLPDGRRYRLRSAPEARGAWPLGPDQVVHVLTAWNPRSEPTPEAVNRARQAALEADLEATAAAYGPAVGWEEGSDYREEGVAVVGLPEAEALALGARYGQNAIYAWTPTAWSVVACDGSRRYDGGWRSEVLPPA